MVGPPDDGEPLTSTREILNRLRGVEMLAQDLQRRVQGLERTDDETAGKRPDTMPPRRDIMGSQHSAR